MAKLEAEDREEERRRDAEKKKYAEQRRKEELAREREERIRAREEERLTKEKAKERMLHYIILMISVYCIIIFIIFHKIGEMKFVVFVHNRLKVAS